MTDPKEPLNALNSASDVIIQYDRELRYVFINEAGCRYFGLPAEEIIGKSDRELMGEMGAATIEPHLRKTILDRCPVTVDNVIPLPSGNLIFESIYTPVFGPGGETQGILGVCRDVTQARRKQTEMAALMISTARLASLGEMAGNVAHEINTPLTVIQLNAEHLKMAVAESIPDTALALRCASAISFTVTRISQVIQGLLSLSRDPTPDAVSDESFFKIVVDTLVLCQDRFARNGVDLSWSGIPDTRQEPRVSCNPAQISQVVLNLLNNAFDVAAVSPSERWVRLELREEGEQVSLRVVDCGKGIPPEAESSIFRPFYTTKPAGKGTGLGLSIAKRLVESNGGSLALDTRAPNTTFVLSLPKAAPQEKGERAS